MQTSSAPACEQPNDGDEESRADDRPDDGKGSAADDHRQRLRQAEVARDPHPDQCADEAEHDGDEAAAAREAANCLTQCPANARDQQQDEKLN